MDQQIRHYEDKLRFEIDAADLITAISDNENLVIVDARSADAFQREHIPGAASFPHREMNEEAAKRLDRAALYVVYCDGIGCNASTKGALNLARLGFTVKELIGGLDWWKRDGHSTHSGMQDSPKTGPGCAC